MELMVVLVSNVQKSYIFENAVNRVFGSGIISPAWGSWSTNSTGGLPVNTIPCCDVVMWLLKKKKQKKKNIFKKWKVRAKDLWAYVNVKGTLCDATGFKQHISC